MLILEVTLRPTVTNAPTNDPGAEKRRSARLLHSVPIIVTGVDALGQPFKESTTTVMVSCTGCKYKSTHYVPKTSALTVEINESAPPRSRRILKARVVWVQRPSNYRDQFHIAVEFDVPGNVWGIKAPPENWFAHPEDLELEIPVTEPVELEVLHQKTASSPASASYSGAFTTSVETLERPQSTLAKIGSQPHMTAVTTIVASVPPSSPSSASNSEKPVLAMPLRETATKNRELEITVQSAIKEALAAELKSFRTGIETEIREMISEAVRTSLAEQAPKTSQELAEKFEEKIKASVEHATETIKAEAIAAAAPKPKAPRKPSKRKSKTEIPIEA
jgi:PilZ domain